MINPVRSALAVVVAGLVGVPAPVSTSTAPAAIQSDLDAFMQKVVARRDENWKKLQQYILDETELIQVRGPSQLPVWGDKREYTWFIKEGYFVRSPLKANGVAISEDDRRKYEDNYLRRAKARDKSEIAKIKKAGDAPTVDPTMPTSRPNASRKSHQRRSTRFSHRRGSPQFIDSAYFLKFKFEQGKYALGRPRNLRRAGRPAHRVLPRTSVLQRSRPAGRT